jgi:DNA-nicking Smr family endonuclease
MSRRRVLSYEERVLWTTVTKSMTPLRNPGSAVPDLAGPNDVGGQDQAASAVDAGAAGAPSLRKPPGPMPKKVKPPGPPAKSAAAVAYAPPPQPAPLSRRMKRSVARGKEQIDARLDLHGLTQHEAHDALLRFLRAASARDARLVLVITGKGKRIEGHGERERGVLRRQVPQWLGLPEFRAVVLGFEDAAISHGGEGALYVRLRRGHAQTSV